jgi:hippurate hydrolase
MKPVCRLISFLMLLCGTTFHCAIADDSPWLGDKMPGLIEFYQDLHRNPELSLEEKRTSAVLAKALTETGATVSTGIGGFGVVAVLKNGDGPVVLVRSDMEVEKRG